MPRYFFTIVDRDEILSDPEGEDFSDLVAARSEAVAAARELVCESLRMDRGIGLHRVIIIVGEDGAIAAALSFTEAVLNRDEATLIIAASFRDGFKP